MLCDPLVVQALTENPVLRPQMIDRVFLLAAQPTRGGKDEELEHLEHLVSLDNVPLLENPGYQELGGRRPIDCTTRGAMRA